MLSEVVLISLDLRYLKHKRSVSFRQQKNHLFYFGLGQIAQAILEVLCL